MLPLRSLRMVGTLLIGLSTSGCSVVYGTFCAAGIAFSHDSTEPAHQLPDARQGDTYAAISSTDSDWQHAWYYHIDPETVPPGVEATLFSRDEDGNEHPDAPRTKSGPTEHTGPVWIKLTGTPEKAGKYTIKVKRVYHHGMCGGSDAIYPFKLTVTSADTTAERGHAG